MFGNLMIIVMLCSAFCGLLAITGAILDYITYKQNKAYKKQYRHRCDKIKLMQTAEIAAIAQPYLKENLKNGS